MKNALQTYFGFSRRQMNGFWLLAILSQALLVWTFYVHPVDNYNPEDRARDLQLLDSMKQEWQQSAFKQTKYPSEKQTSYASKKSNQKSKYKKNYYSKKAPIKAFDIALADTAQLKQIRGIGSKLSARIITFRDNLGGFHKIEQVKEVYGLAPEVQDELLKVAFLGKHAVKKLRINEASEEELRKHPYISYKLAKVIVSYRQQHGGYHEANDLKAIRMLQKETLEKLLPYLDFEII